MSSGVCISHAVLNYALHRVSFVNFSDVLLCFSSLYWISGILSLIWGTRFGATRIITTESFSPELQLRFTEQYKVSFALNATHQIVLMLKCESFSKADLTSIRFLLVGGSKVPFYIRTEMQHYLPNGKVYVGYGTSEVAGIVSVDYGTPSSKDTVGRLANGIQMKIIDDQGNRQGVNEEGEICMKMPFKFIGYYGNQVATDETIDNEGFISSGDIGYYDADGDLFVVDRKKDLLKYYNFPIAPSEIDAFLITSPHIKSACVVGIPEVGNDLPAAVVVRANESDISEQDVFDMVAGCSLNDILGLSQINFISISSSL